MINSLIRAKGKRLPSLDTHRRSAGTRPTASITSQIRRAETQHGRVHVCVFANVLINSEFARPDAELLKDVVPGYLGGT